MMSLYYDRDGIPVSASEWSALMARPGYQRIDRTKVVDLAHPAQSFDVSTVWLGIDHGFGIGYPVIFETMIFAEGSALDEYCARYGTEQLALTGHTQAVVELTQSMTDPLIINDVEDPE